MRYDVLLTPHSSDGVPHIVLLGRVSTPQQNMSNIEASYAKVQPLLDKLWNGPPMLVRGFGHQGSGLDPNREAIVAATDLIKSGWATCVASEDSSRAYREPASLLKFIYKCVRAGVRVIFPADGIDTADENWFPIALASMMRHAMHIPDTVRRLRRTADFEFSSGGWVLHVRLGYKKLNKEEAASGNFGPVGLRLMRLQEYQQIFDELRRMIVEERKGPAALARYLNRKKVPTGPRSKKQKWTAQMIRELLRDPILYGLRQHRKVIHERDLDTYEELRTKNQKPLEKLWPTLAFMTMEEFIEMNAILDEIGGGRRIKGQPAKRRGIPRSDSTYGRQHLTCGICGAFCWDAGLDSLKCAESLPRRGSVCWNHVQLRGDQLAKLTVDLLLDKCSAAPRAMEALTTAAFEEFARCRGEKSGQLRHLQHQIDRIEKEEKSCLKVIEKGGDLDVVADQLKSLQKDRKKLQRELAAAKEAQEQGDDLPTSLEELKRNPKPALLRLARTSFAFGDLMRRVIPELTLQPIQAIDSGQVHPRVLLTLDLGVLVDRPGQGETHTLNCFDPPLPHVHRQAVVDAVAALKAENKKSSLKTMAARLGIGHMTVKRALALQKQMLNEGLTAPYRVLTERPASAARWREGPDYRSEPPSTAAA